MPVTRVAAVIARMVWPVESTSDNPSRIAFAMGQASLLASHGPGRRKPSTESPIPVAPSTKSKDPASAPPCSHLQRQHGVASRTARPPGAPTAMTDPTLTGGRDRSPRRQPPQQLGVQRSLPLSYHSLGRAPVDDRDCEGPACPIGVLAPSKPPGLRAGDFGICRSERFVGPQKGRRPCKRACGAIAVPLTAPRGLRAQSSNIAIPSARASAK